jgi:hypothetical protein
MQLNVEAVYRELAALAEEKLTLDRSVLVTSTTGDSPLCGDAPKQMSTSFKRRYSAGELCLCSSFANTTIVS